MSLSQQFVPTGLQNLVPEFEFMMAYFYVPGKMGKKKKTNKHPTVLCLYILKQ